MSRPVVRAQRGLPRDITSVVSGGRGGPVSTGAPGGPGGHEGDLGLGSTCSLPLAGHPGVSPTQASPGHKMRQTANPAPAPEGAPGSCPPPTPCRHLPELPGLPKALARVPVPTQQGALRVCTALGPGLSPTGTAAPRCGAQTAESGQDTQGLGAASRFPTVGLGPQDVAGVDTWSCDLGCPVQPQAVGLFASRPWGREEQSRGTE